MHSAARGGIDERVGRLDDNALRNRAAMLLGPGENFRQVGRLVNRDGLARRRFARVIFAHVPIDRQFLLAVARQLLQRQINWPARFNRNFANHHGQGRRRGGGSEQRCGRIPLGRVGHKEFCA